jgi:Bacterial protein of unknown function (DUF922)
MALDEDVVARLADAPVLARAAMVMRLQRSAGNAALARRLAAPAIALHREEADDAAPDHDLDGPDAIPLDGGKPAPAKPPAPAAPKRPATTTLTKNCDDCNAAAAILSSGAYVGEANVQIAPVAGEPRVTRGKKGWVAAVDIAWPIDAATSTIEITDFVWPNMTDADKAAVAAFRAALAAHEEGHFVAVEAAIAKLPKTISATGASGQAAMAALQTKVNEQLAAGQRAVDKARDDYDAKTKNGKAQSAVGGTNVRLTCPAPAAGPAPKP